MEALILYFIVQNRNNFTMADHDENRICVDSMNETEKVRLTLTILNNIMEILLNKVMMI